MNFTIKGDHFVGERAPAPRMTLPDDMLRYDSEADFEFAADEANRAEEKKTADWNAFRAYIHYWAGRRRLELDAHRGWPCWRECPTCHNCACGETLPGGWLKCLCAEGKKVLSPYRIVWLNNSKKRAWQTSIWEIGVGFVPRKNLVDRTPMNARGLDGLQIPGASR